MRPRLVLYTTDRRQTADGTGDRKAAHDCTAGRPSHGGGGGRRLPAAAT
jgi:hypothetical protein